MKKIAIFRIVAAVAVGGAFLWQYFKHPIDIQARQMLPAPANAAWHNLAEIGVSFRVWAADHHGQFPFNVSQAEGGTKELCQRDKEGFEMNPVPTFMVMSNELLTPKVLVCPNDNVKKAATNWASLTTNNISYKLRTGLNVSQEHPAEILAIDPVNGLVLRCDGSVLRDSH